MAVLFVWVLFFWIMTSFTLFTAVTGTPRCHCHWAKWPAERIAGRAGTCSWCRVFPWYVILHLYLHSWSRIKWGLDLNILMSLMATASSITKLLFEHFLWYHLLQLNCLLTAIFIPKINDVIQNPNINNIWSRMIQLCSNCREKQVIFNNLILNYITVG